jgi:hypothetical protein
MLLRIAMAIQAPSHVEGLRFARQWHLVDPPMAVRAADPLRYMNAVIEVDVSGQIIYPRPF